MALQHGSQCPRLEIGHLRHADGLRLEIQAWLEQHTRAKPSTAYP